MKLRKHKESIGYNSLCPHDCPRSDYNSVSEKWKLWRKNVFLLFLSYGVEDEPEKCREKKIMMSRRGSNIQIQI